MDQRDWSNSLATTTTPAKYRYDPTVTYHKGINDLAGNIQISPEQRQIQYSGMGGTFTKAVNPNAGGIDPLTGHRIEADAGMGGTWTSGQGGPQITNMPGYQGMKEQQQAGANFSDYQARLNSLIGNKSQDRYQSQIDELLKNPSSIESTPGYQFALTQGTQAIDRSAAAKGMGSSGGVLAELAKYGQGMASQEYGNTINRLSSLSQAERQNQNQNINQLQNIMQGAQQFGLSSGYYNPEQYTQSLGIKR